MTVDRKAGVEMDREVAERVMGWRPTHPCGKYWVVSDGKTHYGEYLYCCDEWKPSTNIAHAWEVVERFAGTERASVEWMAPGMCRACLGTAEGYAHSAPMAICLAALQATRGGEAES